MKSLRQVRFHFYASVFVSTKFSETVFLGSGEVRGRNACLDLTSHFLFNSRELQLVCLLVMSCYSAFLVLWHLGALLTLERLPFPEPANAIAGVATANTSSESLPFIGKATNPETTSPNTASTGFLLTEPLVPCPHHPRARRLETALHARDHWNYSN